MRPYRSFLFVLASPLALVFATGLTACSKKGAPTAEPPAVRDVPVTRVTLVQAPDANEAFGTVQAAESSTLSSQVMGKVARITVHEGDRVRAGQLVVSIDAAQLGAESERASASTAASADAVAAAETDASLAASTLRRYGELEAQNSVSPQEFDEVQARSRAASAHLDMVRSQLKAAMAAESAAHTMQGYARIYAPFDGVVTERKVDPGAMATPGSPLLTVEKSGALQLDTSIDESLLQSARVGASVAVAIDALGGSPIEGRISEIVPAADPASRSVIVKIDLPFEAELRSGMFGRAQFVRGTRALLLVPASSLVTHGSLQSVYVVAPNRLMESRYVTIGAARGADVEVLSGLSAGEIVVTAPGEAELAGKRLEAKP